MPTFERIDARNLPRCVREWERISAYPLGANDQDLVRPITFSYGDNTLRISTCGSEVVLKQACVKQCGDVEALFLWPWYCTLLTVRTLYAN